MSAPIDLVLSRLQSHKLRQNGRDRWRACCPAHDGSNPSALSIGEGQNGAVLLRCWQGCSLESIAASLGLDVSDLFPAKDASAGPAARRRLITAKQALDLLDYETAMIVICASDLARGEALTEETRDRLRMAAARIVMLREEVAA